MPVDPVDGREYSPFDERRPPSPRRGSQLGLKAEIALLLIADAGGDLVALSDIPAAERRYVNSKAGVLEQMGLIRFGRENLMDRPEPAHDRIYSLTDLGRTAVALLRASQP